MLLHIGDLPGRRRNIQFDLLRLIFATLVLLAHAPELTDGNGTREILSRFTRSGVTFGTVGVDGFFLLSGFLIVQSWQSDSNLRSYLRKRVLRIVPGYVVAALLSTLVVGWLAPGVPQFFAHFDARFPASVMMLQCPIAPPVLPGGHYPDVNASLWTIAYEFRCYLLVPIFGLCAARRRPAVWLTATVLLLIGTFCFSTETFPWRPLYFFIGDPPRIFRLTASFFVGGCFCLYREKISFRPLLALAAAVLLCAFAFHPRTIDPALILFGGYLLFYLGTLPLKFLAPMERMPDISYGVYLYGWPVESLWIWYFRGSPWVAFLASTVLCFALGALSWRLVESPMLALKRRRPATPPGVTDNAALQPLTS